MKMIRRMIAILIVTFLFLFVAMLMMKVIRHGGDFTTALKEELQPVLDFLTEQGEKLWHSIDLG